MALPLSHSTSTKINSSLYVENSNHHHDLYVENSKTSNWTAMMIQETRCKFCPLQGAAMMILDTLQRFQWWPRSSRRFKDEYQFFLKNNKEKSKKTRVNCSRNNNKKSPARRQKIPFFSRYDDPMIRIIKCTFPAFVYKDLQKVPQKLASTFGVLKMWRDELKMIFLPIQTPESTINPHLGHQM